MTSRWRTATLGSSRSHCFLRCGEVPVEDTLLGNQPKSTCEIIQYETQQQCWLVPVQVASVVVYMVCGLFSSSFITNFVVVTILLMLDFWTVRLPTPQLPRTLGCHNQALPSCCSAWNFKAIESIGATRPSVQYCAFP